MKKKTKKRIKRLLFLAIVALIVLGYRGGYFNGVVEKVPASWTGKISNVVDKVENKLDDTSIGKAIGLDNKKAKAVDALFDGFDDFLNSKNGSGTPVAISNVQYEGLEIPRYIDNHQVVRHPGYTLSYCEAWEIPDWVAYTLTLHELNTQVTGRSEDFREDTNIITGSATLDDYRNSGFDRGHVLSSASRTANKEENSFTFLLSNMTPQTHKFNAGLYLNAENAERDAARYFGETYGTDLYIVSGPVITDNMKTIGKNKVGVPESMYKVFLGFDNKGNAYAIGMILPQEYQDGTVRKYLCSVNDVEKITGIDFFPSLDDSIEEQVEAQCNYKDWGKTFGK